MFKIPIVQPDLRHEETIIQAAFALDCLKFTIDSIFKRIDERIENNNRRVVELHGRIRKAQIKIKSLLGTTKAIHLYAPTKFPASQVFRDIRPTFISSLKFSSSLLIPSVISASASITSDISGATSMSNDKNQSDTPPKQYEIRSKLNNNASHNMNDKLVFFHVRSKDDTQKGFATSAGSTTTTTTTSSSSGTTGSAIGPTATVGMTESGITLKTERQRIDNNSGSLGTMPSNLRSVPSVLLLNSDAQVYDANNDTDQKLNSWKYVKLHKGKRQQQQPQQEATNVGTSKNVLEPAPHSLAHRREYLRAPHAGFLRYTPLTRKAPTLDLPPDLPDLTGIADDLHYDSQEDEQHIAPSSSIIINDLPEFPELADAENASNEIIKDEQSMSETLTLAPENTSRSQSQPLPHSSSHITNSKSETVKAIATTTADMKRTLLLNTTPPKPPPPPPPPPPQQSTPTTNSPSIPKSLQKVINSDNATSSKNRSDLMEAIRNAGGIGKARLKQTNAAAPITSTASTSNVHSAKGFSKSAQMLYAKDSVTNLMADLHQKLLMRRKGISGTYKDANNIYHKQQQMNAAMSGNPIISKLSALIPPPHPTEESDSNDEDDDDDAYNDDEWYD